MKNFEPVRHPVPTEFILATVEALRVLYMRLEDAEMAEKLCSFYLSL